MDPEELKKIRIELAPLRAARVPLEAVRWTHGRRDGPVGLVTGPLSHARADFSRGLKKTAHFVRVEYFLARLDEPSAVAAAIRRAKDAPEVLLIAVCRGGGDEQGLAVFSHPEVVRAVAEAACIKPVVTGIGHTTDHCLADDFASVAAPLPYAAGEAIHQARQAGWRRLRAERASASYSPAPFRRRADQDRGIGITLLVVGVLGTLLAIGSCPTGKHEQGSTNPSLTPAKQTSPSTKQAPAKKKRSDPPPQKPLVGSTPLPQERLAPQQPQPAKNSATAVQPDRSTAEAPGSPESVNEGPRIPRPDNTPLPNPD
jgi:hypothetical protein